MDNNQHFTGSFTSLFKYWNNAERATKFTKGGTRTKAVRFLLDRAEVEIHKGTWVDTAVGAGYVQKQLYNTVIPALMVGIDFSREMLDLVDEPVARVLGSAFQLPLRERVANVSTNIFCLSDYPDPTQAFEELSRITQSRGVVFFLDYSNKDEYWNLRQKAHNPNKIMGNINLRDSEIIQQYLPDDMREVLNSYIEYEVNTIEFDNRLELPSEIIRVFLFVELYKPRSS